MLLLVNSAFGPYGFYSRSGWGLDLWPQEIPENPGIAPNAAAALVADPSGTLAYVIGSDGTIATITLGASSQTGIQHLATVPSTFTGLQYFNYLQPAWVATGRVAVASTAGLTLVDARRHGSRTRLDLQRRRSRQRHHRRLAHGQSIGDEFSAAPICLRA